MSGMAECVRANAGLLRMGECASTKSSLQLRTGIEPGPTCFLGTVSGSGTMRTLDSGALTSRGRKEGRRGWTERRTEKRARERAEGREEASGQIQERGRGGTKQSRGQQRL